MRTYTDSISSVTGWMTLASLGLTSLALTPSALATDYYASEQWIIQQDFQIDAGDRVIVNQDTHIYLADNATLTINPNATLILQEGVNIDVGEQGKIAVYGELSSLGDTYNMNHFQSVQLSPANNGWQGIDIYNGAVVNIQHTQISHAANAIHAHIGTTILFPSDQNNSDTHNNEVVNNNATQLNIRYSDFNNNHTAINISELHTVGQLASTIQYNQFSDNEYHLYTSSQAYSHDLPMSPVIVDARFNWWSTTDTNLLKQKIQDTQNNHSRSEQENNQDTHGLRVDYSHYRQSIYFNDILTNAFTLQLPVKLKLDDPISIDPGFNRESHYQLDGNFLIAGDTQIKPYQLTTLTSDSMLTVSENTTLTLDKTARFIAEENSVIYLSKNSQINVNGHWQLAEGVKVIAEEGAQINLSGSLYAQGASSNRVSFSAASHLINQHWNGIQLAQGAEINLDYAQIQHAQTGIYANLVPAVNHPLDNNTTNLPLEMSDTHPTSLEITHTRFIDNNQAMRFDVVPETQNVETRIEYNDFVGNNTHLFTQVYPFHAYEHEAELNASQPFSPIVINAKFNWWNSNIVSDIATNIIDFQQAIEHIDGLRVDYSEYRQSMALHDIAHNSLVVKLPEYLKVSDPFEIDPGYNRETEYRLDGDFVIAGDTHFSHYQNVTLTEGSHLHISDDMSLSISPNAVFIIESGASITFGHNSQLLSQGEVIDQNF